MNAINSVLGVPFGWIIWAIYKVINNYAVSLLVFTLLTKLLLFPLGIRQHKTSIKSAIMNPKIQEINKKYGKNMQKRQEETAKLQQEYGYNPNSGCLPTILQFVVLFGVIDVVYKPLTHVLRISSEVIDKAGSAIGTASNAMNSQLIMISEIQKDPTAFIGSLGQDAVNQITSFNMNFLGINLGQQPSVAWPIILIPILATLFSFLQIFIQQRLIPMNNGAVGSNTFKIMNFAMPLLSLWISFTVPAGVGLYWMLSYVFGIIQSIVLYKMYDPVKLREQALTEFEENRKKNRRSAVVTTTVVDEDGAKVEKNLSQKEANRLRLAAARKADAEKYGEEYDDVTDDDLY